MLNQVYAFFGPQLEGHNRLSFPRCPLTVGRRFSRRPSFSPVVRGGGGGIKF